jgi:Peptidase S46
MRILILNAFLLLCFARAQTQGMWLPLHLEKQNEKEMKSMGLKLKADDVYSSVKPSIKDAVVQFNGGCTGEMISPEGLLLTNHHCGFDAIQKLSSLEKNYVENGFWAKNKTEELPCPGAFATFVARMEDVTALALQNVAESMNERDRQSQIDQNLQGIRRNTKIERWQEIVIKPFYNGNQYYLFVTETYRDLRLAGAPPSGIGKFGNDTDNWVWPRHTGDFSMFRVYASRENQPAPYSPDNVPLKPRHFLPVSLDGVEEGQFTMVYGFPGTTNEYLSAAAVQQTAEVLNPAKVAIRDQTLKTWDGFMRKDPAAKIAYVSKYAGIANAWKKWQGEILGLKTYKALDKKREYEAEFNRRIQQKPDWKIKYGNLLSRLETLHKTLEPYALARDVYTETTVVNSEILKQAAALHGWTKTFDESGALFFDGKKADMAGKLDAFYKDYRPEIDRAAFAGQMELFAQKMPAAWGGDFVKKEAEKYGGAAGLAAQMFQNSVIAKPAAMTALLAESADKIAAALKADPACQFWKTLNDAYTANVQPKLQELQPQITLLQRQYMAAQLEVFREKRFFPDANLTLRLTYGKVRGYQPRDGVQYHYRTYLDGVMEKYIPGDYEFDVPKKLIDLWKTKDYGRYATSDGRMPVAFIGSNHTTGGNSGSPALDARGNLVGLNFDRVWEGTMSDLNYDAAICRNIMVDIRYVLFITEKLGGADYLIREMKIVKK